MEDSGGIDANTLSCNGSMQPSSWDKETDNLGDDILDDLDSYFEDIHDGLTVSRMVNDSVIKGMVKAVTEEAAERIAQKELELASLKERLQFYESGAFKVETSEFPSSSADVLQQDSLEVCLGGLRVASEKQFHMLEKKIADIKICRLLTNPSEMEESENWAGVDQTLNVLRKILNTICTEVDNVVCSSKTTFCEWQREQEFQREVEDMIIRNSIRSLQEEFEMQLWKQRGQFCGNQSTNQLAKINQLQSLREELNSISRTLSSPEMGHMPLIGFQEDNEESNNGPRKDHFHRKGFSNHILRTTSLGGANGKHENSGIPMPETSESNQLKHMSKDELVNYFKGEMNKMKRNHETRVHEITEEYFSLRREYLKERGPLLSLKKDKEFDAFRKKIPDVILKMDSILMENEKLPAVFEKSEMICNLKNKIDVLLSEKRQIQEQLTNKSKEVKCLSLQISNAADKMSRHSLAEANLLNQIRKLKGDIEDMKIEAFVREDVCKPILEELIGKAKCSIQDSDMESLAILEFYEIIFKGLAMDARATVKREVEDSDVESVVLQDISEIVFREAAKDALGTINLMKMKYEEESKQRVSLEAAVLEGKRSFSAEIEEKEQLKQKISRVSDLLEEKEKLALEKEALLMTEKERYDQIYQELNLLRNQASQKDTLVIECKRELQVAQHKLEEALGQIQNYKGEITNQDQKLTLAKEDLKRTGEEIKRLRSIIQEKETAISVVEAKEMEHKERVEYIAACFQRLLKEADELEARIMEAVEKNSLRLRSSKVVLDSLVQDATSVRRKESVYKQKLETRYSDLQKAEAEVDLLGDEVDALLSLLEKIYIALHHYSPVLQHYPGIMDVLKLVKRELSVETSYESKGKC